MDDGMNPVSGNGIEQAPSAAPENSTGRPRGWVSFSTRRVPAAALATLEIPMLSVIVIVLGISFLVTPDTTIRGTGFDLALPSACLLQWISSIPGLFCGMTRSFMAMGGLDIRQAFIFNPMGPVFFLATLAAGGFLSWSAIGRRRITLRFSPTATRTFIRMTAAVLIMTWVLKILVWRKTGLF